MLVNIHGTGHEKCRLIISYHGYNARMQGNTEPITGTNKTHQAGLNHIPNYYLLDNEYIRFWYLIAQEHSVYLWLFDKLEVILFLRRQY